MKRLILTLLAVTTFFAAWGSALAATANLTWINATQNTDNSAIPATCPAGAAPCGRLALTIIEYGTCSAPNVFGTKAGEITVTAPATSATVNMVVVQTYCFRAIHENDYLMRGASSNVTSKVNAPPVPGAPSGLTTPATVAYQFLGTADRIGFLSVGTVPADTPCDETQQINGRYVVPKSAVQFYNPALAANVQVVVAQCS
jgi:hypothetical protein